MIHRPLPDTAEGGVYSRETDRSFQRSRVRPEAAKGEKERSAAEARTPAHLLFLTIIQYP